MLLKRVNCVCVLPALLTRNLSSADAKKGETVDFEVLEDVKVNEVIVIAKCESAIATVTEAQSKRRMACGGKLDVNIDYVRSTTGERTYASGKAIFRVLR